MSERVEGAAVYDCAMRLCALLGLFAFGCSKAGAVDSAYLQDVQTICDGPKLAESHLAGSDDGQQMRMIAMTVTDKLRTAEGKAFFLKAVGSEMDTPAQKAAHVRAEATRLNLTSCALPDWLEKHSGR